MEVYVYNVVYIFFILYLSIKLLMHSTQVIETDTHSTTIENEVKLLP